MKRIIWASALALALAAAPAAAQTRVSVAVGFGVPQPYAAGVVVVGRPWWYYRAPHAVVYSRESLFEARRGYRARYHHRRHCEYDDDE